MFENIRIDNYRNFPTMEINDLSRVNIFVGRNNSGKSCLLEAVFLLTGVSNPQLLLSCNTFRDFPKIEDFSYFFHNMEGDKPISLTAESAYNDFYDRTLSLRLVPQNTVETDSARPLSGNSLSSNQNAQQKIIFKASVGNETVETSFVNTCVNIGQNSQEKGEITLSPNYKEKICCSFLSTKYAMTDAIDATKKLIIANKEYEIVEGLRLIDHRVKNLTVTSNEILIDVGLTKKMPINFLGDGMRRLFSIIVNIIACKDGVLLVDEIDNGLHHKMMKSMWTLIVKMANLYNVQLFVTTHNADSLKGIYESASHNGELSSSLAFYKLIKRTNDTSIALHYRYEDFAQLIETENEIR